MRGIYIIYSRTANQLRMRNFVVLFLSLLAVQCHADAISDELVEESGRYIIEGKVYPPEFSGERS